MDVVEVVVRRIGRITRAEFQVQLLDQRHVGQQRNQQLSKTFSGGGGGVQVGGRIDPGDLVEEGRGALQDVGVVDFRVIPIGGAQRSANLAGRHHEQAALDVELHDVLRGQGPVLQRRVDGVDAVLGRRTALEDGGVEAGRTVIGGDAEAVVRRAAVARQGLALAILRRGQHRDVALQRGGAVALGVVLRLAVRSVQVPGEVRVRDAALQASRELPDGGVVDGGPRREPAVRGGDDLDFPGRVRIRTAVQQPRQFR